MPQAIRSLAGIWNGTSRQKPKRQKKQVNEMLQRSIQKFDDEATHEMNSIVILSHDRLFEKKNMLIH
jgi:hypothetical protein